MGGAVRLAVLDILGASCACPISFSLSAPSVWLIDLCLGLLAGLGSYCGHHLMCHVLADSGLMRPILRAEGFSLVYLC